MSSVVLSVVWLVFMKQLSSNKAKGLSLSILSFG